MERKIVSQITSILLLMSMLAFAFGIQPVKAEPTTMVVPDEYSTIQEAINNANERDTIYVRNGTYYENVVLNKSVSLLGENLTTTIIDGRGVGNVVEVTANTIVIASFTIQNSGISGSNAGINLRYSSSGIIYNSNIKDNDSGIRCIASSDYTISGNEVSNNRYAIRIFNSCNNTIIENNIFSNDLSGMGLYASSGNTVIGNVFSGNNEGVYLHGANNNKFFHNNFYRHLFGPVLSSGLLSTNIWDDGYPSGGNYWIDYTGADLHSGPYQNETGNDGIGDTPYGIPYFPADKDSYPLMNPWISSPEETIKNLIRDIESMNFQQGIDNSLDAKLDAVLKSLEALNTNQRNDSINKLYAFIKEVEAQRGNKITNEQAAYLIAEAQRIIDLIKG